MNVSEAFAVVREAAIRKLGMRHFDVQVSLFFAPVFLLYSIIKYGVYNVKIDYPKFDNLIMFFVIVFLIFLL